MTLKRSTKLLKIAMQTCLITYLIASFIACASSKKDTAIEVDWQFIEFHEQNPKACLSEEDVIKIREFILRCKNE